MKIRVSGAIVLYAIQLSDAHWPLIDNNLSVLILKLDLIDEIYNLID